MELSHNEIIELLSDARKRHVHVDVLVSLVLDLFLEVEALREALIKIDSEKFEQADLFQFEYDDSLLLVGKSTYQKAYLSAAYETHNNGGPSGGIDKLLARFYPTSTDDLGRTWRECLLLQRLGFSPDEIDDYKNAAQDAEMLT